MNSFFLSYARADQRLALKLADGLIAAGLPLWVDQYDIRPSEHWDSAVEAAVRNCQGLIAALSPAAAASHNVADEVSVAIESGKQVIPVLIEACTVPLRMTRMQFIDATRDLDGAIERCVRFVRDGDAGLRGGGQGDGGARPAAIFPEATLAEVERRLTPFMGPISARLVRVAAGRCATEAELYAALAASLAQPRERERFLRGAPAPPAPEAAAPISPAVRRLQEPLDADDLTRITSALTPHLGPISARLVSHEAATAASRLDLCERLAARIADARERAVFMRRAGLA